jgi:magnesium transporter
MRFLVSSGGTVVDASPEAIQHRLEAGAPQGFWLDVEAPSEEDYQLLESAFHFHPLAIEDVKHQKQRPKLEEYPGYVFGVMFVADWSDDGIRFREIDLFLAHDYLVTVHHQATPELSELRQRIETTPGLTRGSIQFVTYLVIDRLVDTMFEVLDHLDEEIDELEDRVVDIATPNVLSRITELKHQVTELRRILGAERDMFQRLTSHAGSSADPELALYYRDVYDHLVRQYEEIDSLRDLLSSAMDVYLSVVSNRLNVTVKQLTVVASLFLPLTFLTGFFGMNFATLVGQLASPTAFGLAVALMIFSVVAQLYLFRTRGWI